MTQILVNLLNLYLNLQLKIHSEAVVVFIILIIRGSLTSVSESFSLMTSIYMNKAPNASVPRKICN